MMSPNLRDSTGYNLEKLENADLNEETGESIEQTEKWERFTGSGHSGCFESIAPECLEKLARSLSVMCWDIHFPEDWLCSL